MNNPIEQETLIPEPGKHTRLSCGECDHETRHQILSETRSRWQDEDGYTDLWLQHQTIQCQGCMTISFCEASQFSEDQDYDPNTGHPFLPTRRKLFPNRISGRSLMREAHQLPHGVYVIYEEAHSALCAELKVMAGFGIRAIIEAVCKDQQVPGGNLNSKIDGLATSGLVTQAGAQILHSLRFMGNQAAHEMKSHSQPELNAAFDVVEHLLQTVYILPKLASTLPSHQSPQN